MTLQVDRCRFSATKGSFVNSESESSWRLRKVNHTIKTHHISSLSSHHYIISHYIQSLPLCFSQLACLHSEAQNVQRPSACLETLQSSVSRLNTFQNVLPADGFEICQMAWLYSVWLDADNAWSLSSYWMLFGMLLQYISDHGCHNGQHTMANGRLSREYQWNTLEHSVMIGRNIKPDYYVKPCQATMQYVPWTSTSR